MALRPTQLTIRRGGKLGPNSPITQSVPEILRLKTGWTNYNAWVGTLGATQHCSGRIIRANSIRDPDFNGGSTSVSTIDYSELLTMGYRYWYVGRADVILDVWTTSVHQEVALARVMAFHAAPNTPIPAADADYSLMQWVYPQMRSKQIRHLYGAGRTRMKFSTKPSFTWPARTAIEEPNNWGQFDSLGQPGVDPPNPLWIWVGVAHEWNTAATEQAIGYLVKCYVRMYVTCVRDPLVRVIPVGFNAKLVPYATWTALEGAAEDPDETGTPNDMEDVNPTGTTLPSDAWTTDA